VRAYLPATALHTFLPQPLGFVSLRGVDMGAWFAQVAGGAAPGELPDDAVDPWMRCNALFLPGVSTAGAP
jgi:hypothetical protein